MIIKEFTCKECEFEFEAFLPICARCGASAVRAFRTAPGYPKGVAKRTDRILQKEFDKRGIVNFSNKGNTNRVDVHVGPTASSTHGFSQQPIQAMYGRGLSDLARIGINPNVTKDGQPFKLPDIDNLPAPQIPYGTVVGNKPTDLLNKTFSVASADKNGNVTNVNE